MFLVSTRICLIACCYLVEGYEQGRKVAAPEISEKCNLHVRTLNKVLIKLVKEGILISQVGGNDRGYIFARSPKEITLFEILNAVEGYSRMMPCRDVMRDLKCVIADCDSCLFCKIANQNMNYAIEQYKGVTMYDHYVVSMGENSELKEVV